MKIGELAKATGTPVATIRYYEREDLLAAAGRSDANYRVYDAAQVQRLAFIRHCRCLDMTLDEIRVLLRYKEAPAADCGPVDRLLDDHIGQVGRRIRELQSLERELRRLRDCCGSASAAADCGILDGLDRGARAHEHRPPPARPQARRRTAKSG